MKGPTAVVMNMSYTGLGIARSLGERGIPVIGLTAEQGGYGNYTRYARIVSCPCSRTGPNALLSRLLDLGKQEGSGIIFPTRDDDVLFLDRFREELGRFFVPVIPCSFAIASCLDKWQTHEWAKKAGVAAPRCWLVESAEDLSRIAAELPYPCVMKPVASHEWHQGRNWQLVGARKAIPVASSDELQAEYRTVSRAEPTVLIEEVVPGPDDHLLVAACYLDRKSQWVAGFNTQKLVQTPEGFGTGCIVQTVDRPELFEPTLRLLQAMGYSGIAEVEYKWNALRREYQLIEINPRPWDQHRLGNACGIDLVYLAYCEHAGLPVPPVAKSPRSCKWIAEDVLLGGILRLLYRRDRKLWSWLRLLRGNRVYAVWSFRDPLPSIVLVFRLLPMLAKAALTVFWRTARAYVLGRTTRLKGSAAL